MLNFTLLQIAAQIAVCAYVFANILTQRGHIFEFFGDLLEKIEYSGTWLSFLSRPLGGCAICLSGQLAFWVGLHNTGWNAPALVCFVCVTILITKLISVTIYMMEKD